MDAHVDCLSYRLWLYMIIQFTSLIKPLIFNDPARGVEVGGWRVEDWVRVQAEGVHVHDADEAPRCGTHFQHYLGLCWAMLTHREQQERKKTSKTMSFLGPTAGVGYAFCFAEGEVHYAGHGPDGAHRPFNLVCAEVAGPLPGPAKV